jgi:hypothetical protein
VLIFALFVTWLIRAFHESGYFIRSISYPKKALNIKRISEKSEHLFKGSTINNYLDIFTTSTGNVKPQRMFDTLPQVTKFIEN